ncbi:hypothetical protein EYF80_022917 [Liparis tanakae]|uniref:Uncharacterized protein n=1 Tax=Liparis tanakae TaxID=230148 RepID=A0A4Z2HLX0_9TELE|nr:hypothetical protein EYF80_022917 [Liparis tanakae]
MQRATANTLIAKEESGGAERRDVHILGLVVGLSCSSAPKITQIRTGGVMRSTAGYVVYV